MQKIMKKIIFILAMLFATTFSAYAGTNDDVKRIDTEASYDIKVNIHSLVRYLGLSNVQAQRVEEIQNIFTDCIKNAWLMDEDLRKKHIKNVLDFNLKNMKMLLDEEQYKKYLMVLNVTLRYRGIEV